MGHITVLCIKKKLLLGVLFTSVCEISIDENFSNINVLQLIKYKRGILVVFWCHSSNIYPIFDSNLVFKPGGHSSIVKFL